MVLYHLLEWKWNVKVNISTLIGFGDDAVIIKDVRKDGRLIEVQIRAKNLRCLYDDSSDCIHVGFALALPEVRKILNK